MGRYNRIMKRNNKEFMFKFVLGSVVGVLILFGALVMHNQNKQINQLEQDLYLKQQVEDRADDYTISVLNVKTIQEEMNKLKTYSVLKNSKISMSHTYLFEEESFLGLKKKAELRGSANLVYNYDVSFADAVVTQDKNGNIKVEISEPQLDVESVHYENDTLIFEQEKYNMLCNEKEGQKIMKYFLESFVESGREKIQEMYKDADMKKNLNKIAVLEIQELIKGLNLNDCSVVVKIK